MDAERTPVAQGRCSTCRGQGLLPAKDEYRQCEKCGGTGYNLVYPKEPLPMTDLASLITRVEGATEANQHVVLYDALVHALQSGWITQDAYERAMACRRAEGFVDAALALVPEGLGWSVGKWAGRYHADVADKQNRWACPAGAATPALALVSASLRAREGLE